MAPEQGELRLETGREPRRAFLGWHRPLVDLAWEWLQSQFGTGLAELLVIVPTRQAGRRLRAALEAAGAAGGRPRIVTPEFLYQPAADAEPRLATAPETQLAWAQALRDADLRRLRHLFPIDPAERSFSWAMGTARDLLSLRSTLGEAGLLIADVPQVAGASFADTPRWEELARLEADACRRLAARDTIDAASARRELSRAPQLPAGIGAIALVGLPDPPGIALQALHKLSASVEISVAVFAPQKEAERFDAWGRPRTEAWIRSEIDIGEPNDCIHLAQDPPALAERIAELAAAHDQPAGMVAIAMADTELAAPLETSLAGRGIATHQPAGRAFASHELHALLRLLADLLASGSFAAASELLRHPDYLRSAAGSDHDDGSPFDPLAALIGLDTLAADHLPTELSDAGRHRCGRDTRQLLDQVSADLESLRAGPIGEVLPALLARIFAGREFDLSTDSGAHFALISRGLRDALQTATDLPAPDALEFAIAVLRAEALTETRTSGAIDLQGWLEMLWEDAPHLVLAGANDGKIPEALGGDRFLPNSARAMLGLRDQEDRLVRDSYLLSAMLAARKDGGRVDFFVGRFSESGDPLRPSRLLLRCPEADLPRRALWLCGAGDTPPSPAPPWTAAWKLAPPALPADSKLLQRISVTGFRDYLSCPFRYYLKHGLGMSEVETGKMEMNARDFGILCHSALEDFGAESSMRESTDAGEIADFLIDRLEQATRKRYRHRHAVPVAFQLESAKQRLAWAATIQAAERAAGWRIVDTEWSLHQQHEWLIGGLLVRGTIDRIERHETSGAYRVLDYKTSARPKPPQQAHLASLRRDESAEAFEDWMLRSDDGKTRRWADLQIPLYVRALRELRDAGEVEAGYFNLAPAKADTTIATWDLDKDTLAAAYSCAVGVAGSIRAGTFWPPAPAPQYDDYSGILFGDPEQFCSPPRL